MTGAVSSRSKAEASPDPVLRPSASSYWDWLLNPKLVLVISLGLLRIAVHGDSVLVGIAIIVGIFATAAVFVLAHARISKVWATSGAVFRRNMLGHVRKAARGDVASTLLFLRYSNINPGNGPMTLLALMDSKGDSVLRVQGPSWNAEAVRAFVDAASLQPLEVIEAQTGAREIRDSHPGAIDFSDRRPVAFIFLSLAALIVGFCVVSGILGILGYA